MLNLTKNAKNMKKIFLNMAAITIVLAVITTACNNNDDPGIAALPGVATISGPSVNAAGDSTIVLTATSVGAATFTWMDGNDILVGQTAATLTLRATGLFPDQRLISVAGVNESGTGRFSDEATITFVPWLAPVEVPTIGGVLINACPTPYVQLVATPVHFAEYYIWYRNGVRVEPDPDFEVPVNEQTLLSRSSGTYTVRGANRHGQTAMSAAVQTEWTYCPSPIVEYVYTATGFDWSMDNRLVWDMAQPTHTWNQTVEFARRVIVGDSDYLAGADAGTSVFLMRNWHPTGIQSQIDNFRAPGGSQYTITVHRTVEGLYYIPYGRSIGFTLPGNLGIHQTWIHIEYGQEDGSTYWRFNEPNLGMRLYLETSECWTFFRIPDTLWITTVDPLRPTILARPALSIWRGLPTEVMGDAARIWQSVFNHVFTAAGPAASPAEEAELIRKASEIRWIPMPEFQRRKMRSARVGRSERPQ